MQSITKIGRIALTRMFKSDGWKVRVSDRVKFYFPEEDAILSEKIPHVMVFSIWSLELGHRRLISKTSEQPVVDAIIDCIIKEGYRLPTHLIRWDYSQTRTPESIFTIYRLKPSQERVLKEMVVEHEEKHA